MYNIAILGFGVVGGGVYEVLSKCRKAPLDSVNIKYILDLRTFPGHPLADRVVRDIGVIVGDPSVDAVIETLGGVNPAYEFSIAALRAGKNVITSNKAVVDKYGPELDSVAKQNGVCYLYEASVGGGIPIIQPLLNCYYAERIDRIAGILNGTTNYILTHMRSEGIGLEEALAAARRLGYAEADPHADLAGLDTARKIAILAGIAFGRYIPFGSIPVIEGIENVTTEDVRLAEQLGCVIKLLAVAKRVGDGASICVAPYLVGFNSIFHAVNDVQNAVCITGSATGETLFYGSGAGSLPTAAAVCCDIARAITGDYKTVIRSECEPGFVLPAGEPTPTVTLPNGKKYRMF